MSLVFQKPQYYAEYILSVQTIQVVLSRYFWEGSVIFFYCFDLQWHLEGSRQLDTSSRAGSHAVI